MSLTGTGIPPSNQETEINGFIKQTAAALCLTAGIVTLFGCHAYREIVDPCWPERYNAMASGSVREVHNAQAYKGHILNHSIWLGDFDGDKLNPSGIAKLKYIAHREPTALVMKVWLQNADENDPARRDFVNGLRTKAILAYLHTQRNERQPTHYEVEFHNYTQPTHPAHWTEWAVINVEKNIAGGKAQPFIAPTVGGGSGGGGGGK